MRPVVILACVILVSTAIDAFRMRDTADDEPTPQSVPADGADYMSELTDDDLRLALSDRGVTGAEGWSRKRLEAEMRKAEDAAAAPAAAAAASTGHASVKLLVQYCMG